MIHGFYIQLVENDKTPSFMDNLQTMMDSGQCNPMKNHQPTVVLNTSQLMFIIPTYINISWLVVDLPL